ncbi:MAG: GNAT family N-acetyltransferase [Ruthenibacterium sp.]
MPNFTIRKAVREDVPVILNFIRGIAAYEKMSDDVIATEESVAHAMFDEKITHCILAFEGEKPVGFALYFYNYSTFIGTKGLYLEDLYLLPEHRAQGYGKKLITALFKIAVAENCGRMEWCCLNWNTPSQDFYKSLGAVSMDDWSTWRLTRAQLDVLAK